MQKKHGATAREEKDVSLSENNEKLESAGKRRPVGRLRLTTEIPGQTGETWPPLPKVSSTPVSEKKTKPSAGSRNTEGGGIGNQVKNLFLSRGLEGRHRAYKKKAC